MSRKLLVFALVLLAPALARADDETPIEDLPLLRPFTRYYTPEQKRAVREAYEKNPEMEAFVRGKPFVPAPSVKAVSAAPSVLRGDGAITIRVQAADHDQLLVRVLDPAGRVVHEGTHFQNAGHLDFETGAGKLLTVGYLWDAVGVASGSYTFVVVARRGEKEARAYGSFRIAR